MPNSLCTLEQNKDPASLRAALDNLLREHGLSADAGERAIAKVRAQLERQRELEGIDLSNIIEEEDGGRGGRRRAAARVDYRQVEIVLFTPSSAVCLWAAHRVSRRWWPCMQ